MDKSATKDSQGNYELHESSELNNVRSTTQILSLFQASSHSSTVKVQKDGFNTNNVKENLSFVTNNNKNLNDKITFNVVFGKKTMKKHKTWDNDGLLEIMGNIAVLKNTEGKILNKKKVNPNNVSPGCRISMGNTEIEVVDQILDNTHPLEKCPDQVVEEPPQKKAKKLGATPFTPVGSLRKGSHLGYAALVMPTLNTTILFSEDAILNKKQEVSVDFCLAHVLRPHQRYGVVFLYECIMGMKVNHYHGGILADDMGLGKTLQCITIVWTLLKKGPYGKPILKYVLIVTPSSLCSNWNKEFLYWLGAHRISPYVVDTKNRAKDFKKHIRNSVMIISYEMFVKSYEEIKEFAFDLVICDEGHRLKNNDVKAAKLLHTVDCKRRLLLTGTPIQNDLQEFFSLVDFVNPGILGTSSEYKHYFERPIVASQCPSASYDVVQLGKERASVLREKTQSFILRRTQNTIQKYLPSKHEVVVFCRLSMEQEKLYSIISNAWFNRLNTADNVSHLTILMTLKKICNHPRLLTAEENQYLQSNATASNQPFKLKCAESISTTEYAGKVSIIQTLIKNIKNIDEKLVLVSYYTQTLDMLETLCSTEECKYLRLDGNTPKAMRLKIVEQFNSRSDSNKIFLLSAKAGGVGLNLPGASRLVLFDSDWNPASDAQAMARIWREGQRNDVYIYRLLTTGTIEEKIYQRQISKAGLSEAVIDFNHDISLKLSPDELKDLFTLTTETTSLTHDLIKCSCNGMKRSERSSKEINIEDARDYQLQFEDKSQQQNFSISQLLEWEHYKEPIPKDVLKDIMLTEISDQLTFLFKNSVYRVTQP
ncbi:hypothetical protein KM043_017962 [Ampulex compressa]|nr:hypothetical protein KM043_017962 [Ampulex compressa]